MLAVFSTNITHRPGSTIASRLWARLQKADWRRNAATYVHYRRGSTKISRRVTRTYLLQIDQS
jgi:hypothetical protein